MHHVAIMKKSWGLTRKIINGEKKIESRWLKSRCAPWGKVKAGDIVYFKDSGEPVTIKARVKKVIQFANLNHGKVKEILDVYGDDDGIEKEKISKYYEKFKEKKYCVLIFLEKPKKVKPFEINKTGFGMMSAWIWTDDIGKIKKEG